MRSSTSSFKTYELTRVVPKHHWVLLAVLSFAIASVFTLGWEMYWRSKSYIPTLNDTKDLWASRREILETEYNRTVLIGASRLLFDFNMDVYEKAMGERPLQLATVGTNPNPYLEDLANDPTFSGTVIVGVVPSLYFAPGGPPMDSPREHLKHYREWSPSQRSGHYLGMMLERVFAFLNEGDLTLNELLQDLKIPNREKVKTSPELPPYFHGVDEKRQGWMWKFAAKDEALQHRIQQIWLPLFSRAPPPPAVKKTLKANKARVDKIRARGGHVVYLRLPSTGQLRELENEKTPRAEFWDRLLSTTGAPGIHFEDYPELSEFDCPEWSHLNRQDATKFTQRLMPLFKELRDAGKM